MGLSRDGLEGRLRSLRSEVGIASRAERIRVVVISWTIFAVQWCGLF